MKKIPPFYENFDGTHCYQCVLRGVLEHFEPETTWTWEELDVFTAKEPDKWTWPYRSIVNMVERGYDVALINNTKTSDYIDYGIYETLLKTLGKEAADQQKSRADFDKVIVDIKEYYSLEKREIIQSRERVPTLQDMKDYLDKGYLLACALNPYPLYDLEGLASHLVLVYEMDDAYVHFHNSGKKIIAPQDKAPIEKFVNACKSPTPSQWALTAYKL